MARKEVAMTRREEARRRWADAAEATRSRLADATTVAQGRISATATDARASAKRTADQTQRRAQQTAGQARSKLSDLTDGLPALPSRKKSESTDLTVLSGEQKILYCRVLVGLAAVDDVLAPREISAMYLLASSIGLEPEDRLELRRLITSAHHGTDRDAEASILGPARALSDCLDKDEREAVVPALVHDMVRLARASGDAESTEHDRVVEVAALVFPDTAEQVVRANEQLLRTEEDLVAGRITTSQFESTAKGIISKAVAFGAPITAVSMAGSVAGLGAAGITSGLATLGVGGLLGLSGMVTGIGAVVLLGVVVHQGARYALGTNERSRDTRREHLMQQVITNHQNSIAELTEDIAALARRMESYLGRTTQNEERLAQLQDDLAAFQLALADLESSRDALESEAPA